MADGDLWRRIAQAAGNWVDGSVNESQMATMQRHLSAITTQRRAIETAAVRLHQLVGTCQDNSSSLGRRCGADQLMSVHAHSIKFGCRHIAGLHMPVNKSNV